MKKKFLITILLLVSTAVMMFANELPENEPTEQQQIQQAEQPNVTFKSDYKFSDAELQFILKYKADPQSVVGTWFRYKKLINNGIAMAVTGGILLGGLAPVFFGMGGWFCTFDIMTAIMTLTFGALFALAGLIILPLCAVPFVKAKKLAADYNRLYNVRLKDAAVQYNLLSKRDSEKVTFESAIAFGIK